MTVVLAAAAAVLASTGVFLVLQRHLTRVVIGLSLIGHAANLVVLTSAGGPGEPAFVGAAPASRLLDPLPQAFVLTAIVITFGTTALLLAIAYRACQLDGDDPVPPHGADDEGEEPT